MRRNKKCLLAWLSVLALLCGMSGIPSAAAGWQDPTLYHNDDVWYKDNGAPLIFKNGQYYIPLDILTMFDTVTVKTHAGDNLLLYADTQDGVVYASILYDDRVAAVNGEIVRDVAIFRQNGYYYLQADWICDILGLTAEYGENASGETVLRLSNGEARRSLTELVEANRASESDTDVTEMETDMETNGAGKQIVVFAGGIHARWELDWLRYSGVTVTYLLDEDTPTEERWTALLSGACAVTADNVTDAETVNDALAAETYRRLSVLCGNLSETETIAAAEAGYTVVQPDFTVDSRTNPDSVYAQLVEWLETHDRVVLWVGLDGCSQRMLTLLAQLLADNPSYAAGTLTAR